MAWLPTHLFWIWNSIMAVAQIANCWATETPNLLTVSCLHYSTFRLGPPSPHSPLESKARSFQAHQILVIVILHSPFTYIYYKGCSFNEPLRKWPVNCRFRMFFSNVGVLLVLRMVLTILSFQWVFWGCFFLVN